MASSMSGDVMQIQAKFLTKQKKYAVPDSPYSIPGTAGITELNLLINALLETEDEKVEFDFLVAGELLRLPLQEHLKLKEISWESVAEIEYLTNYPSPTPEESIVHDDWVSSVSSAAEWILTGCYDNTLQLWTLKGSTHKLTIPGHTGPVKAVRWLEIEDPVYTFVSASHDETAMLWQWDRKRNSVECVHVCKGHSRSVDCVSGSPFQKKFATGSYDRMLKIWSSDVEQEFTEDSGEPGSRKKRQKTETAKAKFITPLLTLSGHNEAVTAVQWTDANEVCTSSLDSTIRIWDVEIGGLKSQMNGSKAFLDVSYSPLSRHIVSSSADRHVRLWDPKTKEGSVVKCAFTSHNGWVSCVSWAPHMEHLFISGSYDNILKMWDVRSPKAPLYDMSGHSERILCCDWSLPDHVTSGSADSHLKVYKTQGQDRGNPTEEDMIL